MGERIHLLDSPLGPVTSKAVTRAERAPDHIRVAFHRDAVGIWERVEDGETMQDNLWLTIGYERKGDAQPTYTVVMAEALAMTEEDLRPFNDYAIRCIEQAALARSYDFGRMRS